MSHTVRSAQIRAAILSEIKNSPKTRAELMTALKTKLEDLGYSSDTALDGFIYTMKGKLIQKTVVDGRSVYVLMDNIADIDEPVAPASKQKEVKVKQTPIKIDLIEKTGKLRIEFNGLLIEIGKV